jgi:multidrug transporter EmrE-like cation transporter
MEDPMSEQSLGGVGLPQLGNLWGVLLVLLALNLVFSIVANAAFRVSAHSGTWRDVVVWQVVGNLSGFVTVLTLTGLLRYMPLSIAFPLTTGLSILGVQIVAAKWLFHEPIAPLQWVGSLLIAAGIVLLRR